MATKARPWPRNAEWARSDALMVLRQLQDTLQPIIEHDNMTYAEIYRRVGLAILKSAEVEKTLESVGHDR